MKRCSRILTSVLALAMLTMLPQPLPTGQSVSLLITNAEGETKTYEELFTYTDGEDHITVKVPYLFDCTEFTRMPLDYTLFDSTCKPLTAQSHTQTIANSIADTVSRYYSSYNNGYKGTDGLQEIAHPDGTLYAVIQNTGGGVTVTAEDGSREPLTITNEEFNFGAAGFDDQGRLFILWGKTISQESVDADPEQENLVLIRYDMQGNETGRYSVQVSQSGARNPYRSGNAQVGYHDGQVLCLFNTEWGFPGEHPWNGHQSTGYFGVNADTMELLDNGKLASSHFFGSTMTETEYGFAVMQMGDNEPLRGLDVITFGLTPDELHYNYLDSNKTVFHSSGQYQYAIYGNQLDGNTIYTHLGGIAKSNSTYAIVGKSERFYSSAVYKGNDSLPKGNFDVFVRILDQSLADGAADLAGEERTDLETGEVVDRNIVWLTDTANHPGEKCGDVKLVTLSDGSYCVLWERFLLNEETADTEFDSVRMVILDECGNVLQGETEIQNARLSNTSIMPIVQGNTLHWAAAQSQYDYETGTSSTELTWYSLTLGTSSASEPETALLGDVNGDGTVNAADASEILIAAAKLGAGEDNGLTATQQSNADVNGDGEINVADAAIVLQYAAALGTGVTDAKLEDYV